MKIARQAGAALLALLLAAGAASAQDTDAEVKQVDPAAATVTLRHGEIRHLDMPPMTMRLAVRDPGWLAELKPGDRVRVRIDKVDGRYIVTALHKR